MKVHSLGGLQVQTFSFISQKGGVGKSTLTRQFSVLAAEVEPCLLIDRDAKQATTSKWWSRRQEHTLERPDLLSSEGLDLTRAIGALKAKPGKIFIDTRPAVDDPEAEAARVADLVVVPVGVSSDDLEAVPDTLKILRRLGRRAVIVVNGAKNEARAMSARAALGQYPFPVCPHHLPNRTVYLDAHLEGRGVGEMKGAAAGDALAELQKVWAWVQEAANNEH
jgi:chromosome partitioning protein